MLSGLVLPGIIALILLSGVRVTQQGDVAPRVLVGVDMDSGRDSMKGNKE